MRNIFLMQDISPESLKENTDMIIHFLKSFYTTNNMTDFKIMYPPVLSVLYFKLSFSNLYFLNLTSG